MENNFELPQSFWEWLFYTGFVLAILYHTVTCPWPHPIYLYHDFQKKALCPQNRSNLSNVEVRCMHTHMIKDHKQYYPWVSELCLTSHQQLRVIWTNWRSWGLNMGPRRVVYPLHHGGYYMTPDFWYLGYENQERFHTTCHLMQTRRVSCIQFNIQLTLVN